MVSKKSISFSRKAVWNCSENSSHLVSRPFPDKKDGEGKENMINLWILTSFHSVQSTPSFSLYKLIDGCLDLHHSNGVQILKYPLSLQNEGIFGVDTGET